MSLPTKADRIKALLKEGLVFPECYATSIVWRKGQLVMRLHDQVYQWDYLCDVIAVHDKKHYPSKEQFNDAIAANLQWFKRFFEHNNIDSDLPPPYFAGYMPGTETFVIAKFRDDI